MPTNLEPIQMADAVDSARQTAFLDGAERGASLMVAALAAISATAGSYAAEKVVLMAAQRGDADALAAIVVKHAGSQSASALEACAAELVAWAERGN